MKIEGKILNETPLRIGSGRSTEFSNSDNPIITRGENPFIPGSSIKGALRSIVEAYVNTMIIEKKWNNVKNCEPGDKKCETCSNEYCIACLIFGHTDIASRFYVLDSIPKGKPIISTRTMVSINRIFGSQQRGNLYTLDFVDPGTEFTFSAILNNLNILEGEKEEPLNKAVEALRFALCQLKDGIFIGGRKSTGNGLIKLVSANLALFKLEGGDLKKISEKTLEEVCKVGKS
ncbi:CRISPR-associated protein [Candidatus Acidianus copahuensis]|uniref:CRISPR-associated protein n=1 Tax=Candidatus Acidianus copahuensis TaxID=1160895 RepID=A0A031LU22_9CREN|nr:CRISPR-associated protein [Candidatus Acidianus copahuensis]